LLRMVFKAIAFSSEVETGSREENASKQKIRASVLIQSKPKGSSGPIPTSAPVSERVCRRGRRTDV
jgi:hypothetical protein